MSRDGVLVVERHGLNALHLRRAGLDVVELGGESGTTLTGVRVCVVDAVGPVPPDARVRERVLEALDRDPDVVLLVLVSGPLPSWLADLAERPVLLRAPVSGPALAARVTAALAAAPVVGAPVPADEPVLDLGLSREAIIDLAGDAGAEPPPRSVAVATAPVRRWSGATRGSGSVPLALTSVEELVAHLRGVLRASSTLTLVGEELAARVAGALGADVAVLVPDVEGTAWSVVAGVGLRAGEWRPLVALPPLVERLQDGRPILRVSGSADVRGSAAGLPCAGREHLLVGRCTDVDVVVTAGRDEPPLSRDDVRALGRLLADGSAFADALLLRDLAVDLGPYAPGR